MYFVHTHIYYTYIDTLIYGLSGAVHTCSLYKGSTRVNSTNQSIYIVCCPGYCNTFGISVICWLILHDGLYHRYSRIPMSVCPKWAIQFPVTPFLDQCNLVSTLLQFYSYIETPIKERTGGINRIVAYL